MVIRHNSQPRSASQSVFRNPSAYGFRHLVKLGVGAALDVIVALDFQSDVIRPALRAFDKTIVESGHESCGIYTKKLRCTTYCPAQLRKKASVVCTNCDAASRKTGPWFPLGTTQRADRGIARYISTAISTG